MKINTNNSKRNNKSITLIKKNNTINNNIFAKMEMRTSKNLADINEGSFDISNTLFTPFTSFISYTNRSKMVKSKNLRKKLISNIILNNDQNANSSEKATNNTSHFKSINISKRLNNSCNKNLDKSSRAKLKAKKNVNFKKNFVTIIQVESYKEYNVNKYLNNINCINCSCIII